MLVTSDSISPRSMSPLMIGTIIWFSISLPTEGGIIPPNDKTSLISFDRKLEYPSATEKQSFRGNSIPHQEYVRYPLKFGEIRFLYL